MKDERCKVQQKIIITQKFKLKFLDAMNKEHLILENQESEDLPKK
mgnify:CR=1 FL=1